MIFFPDVLHVARPDDGGDDGDCAENERIGNQARGIARRAQSPEQHGGDQGHGVGFKEVGSHTSAVTHVVAHVVGDDGRIARDRLQGYRLRPCRRGRHRRRHPW